MRIDFSSGICCAYGNGSYKVRLNGAVVASGGDFRYSDATAFELDGCDGVPTGAPTASPPPPEPTVLASYDAALGAPRCGQVGGACGSGSLLNSRGSGLSPAEPNRPNTLDACVDGNDGSYHSDESLDAVTVRAAYGGLLTAGGYAVVEADVWAWDNGSSDYADFYYNAGTLDAPIWRTIAEDLQPGGGGARTITSPVFVMPDAPIQAVRVVFRYGGSAAGCPGNSGYDDVDDLVFAVAAAEGLGALGEGDMKPAGPLEERPKKPLPELDCEAIDKKDKQRCAAAAGCVWRNGQDKGCFRE